MDKNELIIKIGEIFDKYDPNHKLSMVVTNKITNDIADLIITSKNFSQRLMKCFRTFGYCATVRFPGNNDHTDFKNYKVVRVYTEADNDRDVKYQLGKILDKKYGYSWSIEDIKSPVSESSCDMHIFDLQRLVNQ